MGILGAIGDTIGKAVLEVKADTSQARDEIKKLSGAQKEQAQQALKGIEDQNKAIDGQIALMGKLGGTVAAAYAIGKAGFEEYTKTLQLQAGTAGVDMQKLSDAAGGLVDKMSLLQIAQAGSKGAWKLNSDQIAEVIKDMRGLTKEGFDQAAVQEKLTEVLKKGTVEQLKEFGIVIKQTNVASVDSEATLKALREQVSGLGGDYSMAGDDVKRSGVQWTNTLHDVKVAIGELVVAMGPMLKDIATAVSLLGQLPDVIKGIANSIPGLPGGAKGWLSKGWRYVNPAGGLGHAALDLANYGFSPIDFSDDHSVDALAPPDGSSYRTQEEITGVQGPYARRMMALQQQRLDNIRATQQALGAAIDKFSVLPGVQLLTGARLAPGAQNARGGGGAASGPGYASRLWQSIVAQYQQGQRNDEYLLDMAGDAVGDGIDWDIGASNNDRRISARQSRLSNANAKAEVTRYQKRQSKLEAIFGPVSDFKAYAAGFDLLTTAVTSAFDAWMSGQKSIGDALKDTFKSFATTLGHQAVLEALKNTAYGIAQLADPNPLSAKSAGGYFKAAAVWTGVAIAAGAASHAIGGSGGAAGAGAGSSGGYSNRALPDPRASNARPLVIVHGAHDDYDTPRSRAARFQHTKQLADSYAERSTWDRT